MITFLPLASFTRSAAVLDSRRLGKQRLEAMELLDAIRGLNPSLANHPAAEMWRGHERSLAEYGLAVCQEWKKRGFADIMELDFKLALISLPPCELPSWFGDVRLHASHRANLVRKDPRWYVDLCGWQEHPMNEYWWPTRQDEVEVRRKR